MILAADVGGTKTLMALFDKASGDWHCVKKQKFASSAYAEFKQVLAEFLADQSAVAVSSACIGVAGPVIDGRCDATNLPWTLDTQEITQSLGTDKVWLLNDLEATAWGLLSLPEQDFVELNPKALQHPGNKAVLAAGTGLGEAIIASIDGGKRYHVIATEGGHCDFAPTRPKEIALLEFLINRYGGHVSYERVVSGEGLPNIYHFLTQNTPVAGQEQLLTDDMAAVITQAALQDKDPKCIEALTFFCRIYGAEAGNLALKCLPFGGLYLAGGIAAKILPFLQTSQFMDGFLDKGRYHAVLRPISVKVCINQEAALTGAFEYAVKML
ncbi:MAG: glucokinase [Gammaproteobacteria bacterium HGW-Gammaproteobacteria-3]|nr:MAG: glucokinase [Gammaproteobacteria bacterium HGW-Gammaproteobacteria-3]